MARPCDTCGDPAAYITIDERSALCVLCFREHTDYEECED